MSKQTEKKKKKPFEYFVYDFVKVTAAPLGMLWFRPKNHYENDRAKERIRGGALIIANHHGRIDPISLMFSIWYRRQHYVCLNVFFEQPVSAWFFKRFHCIPVNRENMSTETLRAIVDRLKDEHLVCMFPEGHMVIGAKQTEAFKSGMVLISVMSKKPVIPVYLAPKKHFFARQHTVIGEPVDIVAEYGPMPTLSQIEEITVMLRQREEALRRIYESRYGRTEKQAPDIMTDEAPACVGTPKKED